MKSGNPRSHFLPLVLLLFLIAAQAGAPAATFRAGAHIEDITPTTFPVIVNAMFTERSASKAVDPLHVRALALDDGKTRLAIAVVDTCMMPRDLIDESKELARQQTGMPVDRILVSATHTHSAPSAMGCLGSRADTNYARSLPPKIAAAIAGAVKNLEPARIGWTAVEDWDHTFNRRWIRRPDRMIDDPFGQRTVRAHMHPGHQSADVTGPSGPVDPWLTMLSVQARDGRPIALLANYSMHYYESPLLSSDYFGRFANKIAKLIGDEFEESSKTSTKRAGLESRAPFVGIMSQGTSGDLMWMDYGAPRNAIGYDAYADELAQRVFVAWKTIQHRDRAPLAMREARLPLTYRVPDAARLAWAKEKVAKLGGKLPQQLPDIYAWEQVYLHDLQRTELKLQAIRIGEFGIAAIPNEVYAITGLKLKARSPLQPLMNIELANGAEGYIPPPEQHKLGGYTTWAARTAGLEIEAEPKIVETFLKLLEDVSGKRRSPIVEPDAVYMKAVLASKPAAFWRLNEAAGNVARSSVKPAIDAAYEDGIALYLRGVESAAHATNRVPQRPNAFSGAEINRAPHLAGGRLRAQLDSLGDRYSVEFWFWNGLPNDARPVTAYLFSRGEDGASGAPGDHLGIGGTHANAGRLIFFNGNKLDQLLTGDTLIEPRTWNHMVLTRDGQRAEVWLNGALEIAGAPPAGHAPGVKQLFFGGRSDNFANLEGKLDEAAVYDRVLKPEEIRGHFAAASRSGDGSSPVSSRGRAVPAPKGASGPLIPDDALASFETEPGLRVELAAAEPLVADPAAICFDERGRMFVAENRGYPTGPGEGQPPAGIIALLEDKDGDGQFETRHEFATGLTFPNGLMPWQGGVIVTCAPDVLYLKDNDGDGRADVREVWLTGFDDKNTTQLRVSHPTLGPDGWIHLTSGWTGASKVQSPKFPQRTVVEVRTDSRFNPFTGELQAIDGRSQFGQSFDDFGHRFICFNRVHVQHVVLASEQLRRNPNLSFSGTVQNCPETMIGDLIAGQHQNPAARIYAISENVTTADSHAGTFTAACAVHVYRGDALPGYYGRVFACDPTGNLVHWDDLVPSGGTFVARRATNELEFLRTRDNWFRPVNLATGPDGALYVCDMYRKSIEHPQYLPEEVRKRTDFESGKGMGRIWRVTAAGRVGVNSSAAGVGRPKADRAFKSTATTELVELLKHPNGWHRDTAQRLLFERQAKDAASFIEKLLPAVTRDPETLFMSANRPATDPTGFGPHITRAVALQTLATLADSDATFPFKHVIMATADPSPGLRKLAWRLASRFPGKGPEIADSITLHWANDPSAAVRFQYALTLGGWEGGATVPALARIGRRDGADRWTRAAVLSGIHKREVEFTQGLQQQTNDLPSVEFMFEVGRASGGQIDPIIFASDRREDALWQIALVNGLASTVREPNSAKTLLNRFPPERMAGWTAAARSVLNDAGKPLLERQTAVTFLAFADAEPSRAALMDLLTPREPAELHQTVIRQLAQLPGDEAARELFGSKRWTVLTPPARGIVLTTFLSQPRHIATLLTLMESGQFPPNALTASQRDQLLKSKDESTRTRAEKLFAELKTGDRMKAFEQNKAVLTMPANPRAGQGLFKTHCASCHRLDREGVAVGPDLFGIRNQPKEAILLHLIVPNYEIMAGFAAYDIETRDGRALSGIVTSESPSSITLRQSQGIDETIRRDDIASLNASGKSLMPDALEATMSRQELADLIAYLKGQ